MSYEFTEDVNDKDFVPHHKRHSHIMSTRTDIASDFKKALANQPTLDNPLSFFTGKNIGSILVDVFYGLSVENALKRVGIPTSIYLAWQSHALKVDGLVRRFLLTIATAKIDFELTQLKNLSLQSSIDPKTSMLLLERTRNSYAPKSFIAVETISSSIVQDLSGLISSGAMSVQDIVQEIGELDEESITYLHGIQRQRTLALESSNQKSKEKYLVQ